MVPSSNTIARWRHLVRILARLVGVPLVIIGAILLIRGMLGTVLAMMQGQIMGGVFYWAYLSVTPLLVAGAGITLVMFDKRLASLIVPMPQKGCPNCGYWIGARELVTCPECGIDLGENG